MRVARTIIFFVASAIGLGFFGARADETPTGKRIALIVGPTQDKYLGGISRGFDTTAKADGMSVTTFSSPFDPALQAQQIDDAIAQKFDMLVVQPISQKAIVPELIRAKAAGIPVSLVVVPLDGASAQDLYLTYAGYDDTALGTLAGESMAAQLEASGRAKAKIAIIAGSMDEGKAPLRQKAFVAALAKHPGFEVVATEDVKWNPVTAERTTGQLLARFAGQGGLDAIYGMNDTLANAAIQAAGAAGVKLGSGAGDFIVVGGNCQAVGIKNIEAGKMAATLLVLPTEEGKLAAEKVADYFRGKSLEKAYLLPSEPITAKNVAANAEACSY
jgi:ribose transport system substrate-binding protein